MQENGLVAGQSRGVTPRRQGARVSGGASRAAGKTVRIQLHLGEQTARRLAVHSALVGRNQSRLADEILIGYLGRFGRGREIFEAEAPAPDQAESDAPPG
jgi:hypothetical protein